MEKVIFIIIVAIIVADFAFDRIMDYLNASRWSNTLPKELTGIYDEEKYKKSQDYLKVNLRLGLITSGLSFLLILGMLIFGGFGWLDGFVRQFSTHHVVMALLFFALLGLASDILSTPFDIYSTFVIEERFGFNRTKPATYVLDKLKGWALALVLGGGLLAVFVWFYSMAGQLFWLYAWLFLQHFRSLCRCFTVH